MTPRRLVLGTRGSLLARTQSGLVAEALRAAAPGLEVVLEIVRTEGDRLQAAPPRPGERLAKGLFTGALEDALRAGRIDLAVHSMKDLPVERPPGLVVAAVPPRALPGDVLVTRGPTFRELPAGARVATGAPRRVAQLATLRGDLEFVPVRGNVDTRLARLRDGAFDALVLAAAGLVRLGRLDEATERLPLESVLPAPGQGALAVEMRAGPEADAVRAWLDDAASRVAVDAERGVLAGIGGGCAQPLGAHAVVEHGTVRLSAVLYSEDLTRRIADALAGAPVDAGVLGRTLAARLLAGLAAEGRR